MEIDPLLGHRSCLFCTFECVQHLAGASEIGEATLMSHQVERAWAVDKNY